MYDFVFPEYIDDFKSFRNREQLRQRLKQAKQGWKEKTFDCNYKLFHKEGKYIYAYCTQCKGRLRYNYNGEDSEYKLTYSNNHHSHGRSRKQLYDVISQFIKCLPSTLSQSSIKQIVVQTFRIKQSNFYYIYKKCMYPQISYKELVEYFQSEDCFIQSDPWKEEMNQIPDILIVVSQKMKILFQKFGQFIYFDTTFNLVRNAYMQGKKYKLGIFCGLNSSKKIIPFGYCLLHQQTKENFYKIFKSFIQIMGSSAFVMITDQSHAIKSAINELKSDRQFQGFHLLDNFHIFRNLKRRIINKQYLKHFRELLRIRYHQKFERQKNLALDQIEGQTDSQILQNFLRNSRDYCYSQTPIGFVGISISDSPCEKINDIVKARLHIQRPFSIVARQTLKIFQSLIQKSQQSFNIERRMIDQYYCFPELKYIRHLLSRLVFRDLMIQVRDIYRLEARKYGDEWQVYDNDETKYVVSKGDQDLWSCDCHYLERSGLPCSHLIKIVKLQGSLLESYIHQRWKKQYYDGSQMKKLGRGKKTRRNRS